MTPERQARAERIRPYLALQLALARRMAELTGAPLSEMTLRHTNFHRRFGLGRLKDEPSPGWLPYAAALDACPDAAAQEALTHATFLQMPEEGGHEPERLPFGCFACDLPDADGLVQIHFLNLDTDGTGGPLTPAKLARRQGEMAAMTRTLREEHPSATHIRGRSWLYNLAAYRRVFPPDYGDSARPYDGSIRLQGNSLWGQTIDSWERVKPGPRDAVLSALPTMNPARPWEVFPLQVLETVAPIGSFEAFYGRA